jgi:hypothetical protein
VRHTAQDICVTSGTAAEASAEDAEAARNIRKNLQVSFFLLN